MSALDEELLDAIALEFADDDEDDESDAFASLADALNDLEKSERDWR